MNRESQYKGRHQSRHQLIRKVQLILLLAGCMIAVNCSIVHAGGSATKSKEVTGYLGRTVAEALAAFDDLILMGEVDDMRLVGQGARFDVKLTGKSNIYNEVIYRIYVTGKDTDYTIHGLKPGVNPDDPYKKADCRLEPAGSTEYWDEKDNIVVLYDSLDPVSPSIYYYDPRLM